MSFNGSGVFVINTTGQPVVTGTVINSSSFNSLTADLATGLSTCLTKDGQSTPTANIKLGGYKLTNVGAPTTSGDALSFGNVATISTATITTAAIGTLTLTNPLGTAYGGTGLTVFTSGGAVYATSTSALTTGTLPAASGGTGLTSPGTSGNVLMSTGSAWASSTVPPGLPDVIVQNQQTSGTAGAATGYASAWETRTLNTIVRNNGSLASLASNRVTLPAGTWMIRGYASLYGGAYAVTASARARIYNYTDSAVIASGGNVAFAGSYDSAITYVNSATGANPEVIAVVVLSGSKAIELQVAVLATGACLTGAPVTTGAVEIYASFEATKVA